MNTVWTFGDSFIAGYNVKHANKLWTAQVADKIHYRLELRGMVGSSLSYMYEQFNNIRDNVKNNDVVIIAPTELSRKWLVRERPDDGPIFNAAQLGTTKQQKAVMNYIMNLQNLEIEKNYLINFLYGLHYLTEQKKLHTIVLTTFKETAEVINNENLPLFHISDGLLCDNVQREEFEPKVYENWMRFHFVDCRPNHLCRSNHEVMAKKILDNIQNNEIINLNTGFHKEIIQHNTKHFCDYELFGNKWTFG